MKCPECKKEINHLLHVEIVKQYWKATPELNSDLTPSESMAFGELVDSEAIETRGYICPECNEDLCLEREDAYELFKGEK